MHHHHHLCYQSLIILILLNIFCQSSPIPYANPNEQDQTVQLNEEHRMRTHKPEQMYNYNILCALYNDCVDEKMSYFDLQRKRLSSSLFDGIPKFGKRAFISAFSGIPKFG